MPIFSMKVRRLLAKFGYIIVVPLRQNQSGKTRKKIPFSNPVGFVKANEDFSPVKDVSEFRVQWGSFDGAVKVNVFIHDELFAILVDGEKPGWSILAKKNGPLAKVLEC